MKNRNILRAINRIKIEDKEQIDYIKNLVRYVLGQSKDNSEQKIGGMENGRILRMLIFMKNRMRFEKLMEGCIELRIRS